MAQLNATEDFKTHYNKTIKADLAMDCTLKASKKDARNFRASFTFVLYSNKWNLYINFHLLREPKTLYPS